MTINLFTNNVPPPKREFYYIKIKTGETLLSELRSPAAHKGSMLLYRPILVKDYTTGVGMGTLVGEPWVPFTDQKIIPVDLEMVFSMAPLNKEWVQFYANSLLKQEIQALQQYGNNKLKGDKYEDYYAWYDTYNAMLQVSEKYRREFGIEPPTFEEFKAEVDKRKPLFH